MQTNPTPDLKNGKWPDFYAILGASSELSNDELRRVVSACYQEANSKMDHRDLSVRFYNQVLAQKVLPACRNILLNPEMRALYDEQLLLHRESDPKAISYQEFVVEVARTKTSCLLNEDELSILPSVSSGAAQSPLAALKTPHSTSVKPVGTGKSENVALRTDSESAAVGAQAPKKAFPWAPVAGIAVLLLGAGGWAVTRSSPPEGAEASTPLTSPVEANIATNEPSKQPAPQAQRVPLNAPMKLNSLAENSDFEETSGEQPWVGLTAMAYIETVTPERATERRAPKSGDNKLTFWSVGGSKSRVSQDLVNLPSGVYTLTAWTRRSDVLPEAYMFISNYGGTTVKSNIPQGNYWRKSTIKDVKITGGSATIGFYCSNSANNWLTCDAVEFYRQS